VPGNDVVHKLRAEDIGHLYSVPGELHDDEPEYLRYKLGRYEHIVRYFFGLQHWACALLVSRQSAPAALAAESTLSM